jgi:Icc-related predicted phosphoesterase
MKILAIADRKPETSIKEAIVNTQPDVIVTLGDLDYFDLKDLEIVNNIPKIGVYGNHCSGVYFDELDIENMHMKTKVIHDITFGGFEGCIKYKESKYAKMYTQEEASEMLIEFPYVDVMLCHAPPYGVNDEPEDPTHTGFIGLRDYVERCTPKHLFHGHTYPAANTLTTQLGTTAIHYVSGMSIIEIEV